jgi:hypothetical protein
MNVFEVTSKVIYSAHGWAVAEQFDATVEDRNSFDEQNTNALNYIWSTVKDLVINGPFDEDATDELEEYLNDLSSYLDEDKKEA